MKSKGLLRFISGKLLRFILLITAVCVITFALMELSPIDPVTAYVGANTKVSAEQRQLISEHWGLNKPPLERFWAWFSSILSGDWGTSMIYRRDVLEVIGTKFRASLALMFAAWVFSGVLGFLLGLWAGLREGKLADKLISGYCHILISTPTFWVGILFIIVFSVWLKLFPVALGVPIGVISAEVTLADKLYRLILPALALGFTGIANICLHTRGKVVEVMHSEYVIFARARGERTSQIILRHVMKNVSLPAVTLQFLSFSELFGGAIFVEQVFSYPGLGSTVVQAGLKGDLPLLMGIVIISVVFVYSGNLIADLLYWLIDPRIKEGYRHERA